MMLPLQHPGIRFAAAAEVDEDYYYYHTHDIFQSAMKMIDGSAGASAMLTRAGAIDFHYDTLRHAYVAARRFHAAAIRHADAMPLRFTRRAAGSDYRIDSITTG